LSNRQRVSEKVLSRRQVYLGQFIEVLDKVVQLPDDRFVHRDIVSYPGGAVCVVAVTDDKQIVLVRQFRPAPEKILLEIPAGRRGIREHFLTAAQRELREETGYTADSWKKCVDFWPSPGFVNERLTMFLARGLRKGSVHMDADEFIRPALIPAADILERCRDGSIVDAKTLIGLLWYLTFESQKDA